MLSGLCVRLARTRPCFTISMTCRNSTAISLLLHSKTYKSGICENDVTSSFNITTECIKRVKEIIGMPQESCENFGQAKLWPLRVLRVTVTPGGCQGFNYSFSFESKDIVDTERDCWISTNGVVIVLRKKSLRLISGSTIDFRTELRGSAFVLRDNPNSDHSCSCGSSFSMKRSCSYECTLFNGT